MRKMTRARAIRMKCLDCSAYVPGEVKNCKCNPCPLWPYRTGRTPDPEKLADWQRKHDAGEKKHTRSRAIRKSCLECMNQMPNEVRLCVLEDCPHWPYRLNRTPDPDELAEWQRKHGVDGIKI